MRRASDKWLQVSAPALPSPRPHCRCRDSREAPREACAQSHRARAVLGAVLGTVLGSTAFQKEPAASQSNKPNKSLAG